ncbi:MAG: FIST signal transduction protein [Promethearchaeota archaeon]
MIIEVDRTGTVEGFKEILDNILKNESIEGLFIFSCDKNNFTKKKLDYLLLDISIPIFGGIFPSIIYNSEVLENGTIISGLSSKPNIQLIPNLSSDTLDYDDVLEKAFPEVSNGKTMVVIVDGMSKRVNTLLESLFIVFGLELKYFGGGAGSLDLIMKPCLFTNEGLMQDCAILALIDKECGVGVRHGMKSIDGSYKITEAKGNTIYSLNWEPAFSFYKNIIEKHPKYDHKDKGFYGVDTHFALGINRLDAEKIVLEPLGVYEKNELLFSPEIKEGEFVDILRTTPESSIKAAKNAFEVAKKMYKGKNPYKTTICFECTARQQFLGGRFSEEVNAIYDGKTNLIGALTIGGEIANNGNDYLEYYNRTCIVATFED